MKTYAGLSRSKIASLKTDSCDVYDNGYGLYNTFTGTFMSYRFLTELLLTRTDIGVKEVLKEVLKIKDDEAKNITEQLGKSWNKMMLSH